MDKLQFLVQIFAVLLSKLCNVLLCKIYLSSFSILKIAALRYIRLTKIKKKELYIRRWGPACIIVPNFIKIGQTVGEIWRLNCFKNGNRPPSWLQGGKAESILVIGCPT